MMKTSDNIPLKAKQFRLVKFFASASFIVLVIFSFPFSLFISQKAKTTLLESFEKNALLVGEHLNHQVYENFVKPVTRRYGAIKLSERQQYELMDQVVRNTLHGFNIDVVNIYAIGAGVIAYSTNPKLIGMEVKKSLGYKKAVDGESSSGMLSRRDDIWGLGLPLMGGNEKLRTYIPFVGINPFTRAQFVGGVFEIIQDMSEEYESIVKLQYLIIGLSVLFMGMLFLALLFIVHKAEKLIEQRAKEQRELQNQLHQAERLAALGEMVAGVSHEIKNPLGIVRSTAELLESMPDAGESQKRLSAVIKEESNRLNTIVTEFLDFARPQVPNLQETRTDEIIEKNLSFLKPEIEKKGLTIHTDFNGKSFRLMGDPEQLYRAFLNIFINAMQALEDGGTIDVRMREEKGAQQIEIEDTGPGIGEENLKKIFNPFYTTKEKGTGLGLSIVRKIIEGHDGRITFQSQVGKGTKVTVQLPTRI